MPPPPLSRLLAPRLPFFYGWVVLVCLCLSGFARQGPAVATLSVFVVPMTTEFGWSRAAIAGAVSLGGVLAATIAPPLGRLMDRHGARMMLCLAVLGTGLSTMALSLTSSLMVFYLLFCFSRMVWAAPFELGLYGALNNWFVARRARATAIATLFQMSGLVAMPLIGQYAMRDGDWRAGWFVIGATVLIVGFLPSWALLVRQPEDLGLVPDQAVKGPAGATAEPTYTRQQAMRTRAFWMLALFTVLAALEARVGAAAVARHVLAITEATDNPLRRLATRLGCTVLDHDPKVGGRYSALSLVGLLPAMIADRAG